MHVKELYKYLSERIEASRQIVSIAVQERIEQLQDELGLTETEE